LRIFLLIADEQRTVFYSEDGETPLPSRGGWLARKGEWLRRKLVGIEKGFSPRMRRFWTWLQKQTFPDEPMLRQLRHARFLEIHYPTSIGSVQAASLWEAYLKSRKTRHTWWMVADLILCALAVVLAVLPGPSVVQYWLFYRFTCHLYTIRGLQKAERTRESTTFLPSSILDVSPESPTSFADVAAQLGFTELDSFLIRINHVTEPPADPCASSATTSTRGSAGVTDAIASNESST
jgi:hypothetical protein